MDGTTRMTRASYISSSPKYGTETPFAGASHGKEPTVCSTIEPDHRSGLKTLTVHAGECISAEVKVKSIENALQSRIVTLDLPFLKPSCLFTHGFVNKFKLAFRNYVLPKPLRHSVLITVASSIRGCCSSCRSNRRTSDQ